MLPGMNPAKMQSMMKQMGINQKDIPASRVVIECEGENVIIENPQVVEIDMKGNKSFQISGDVRREESSIFSDEDVKIVMEKTGSDEERVREVLEKNKGDIAESIGELS